MSFVSKIPLCVRTFLRSYYMIAKKEYRPEPLKMIPNAPALNYNPNLSAYDGLMVGGEAHG